MIPSCVSVERKRRVADAVKRTAAYALSFVAVAIALLACLYALNGRTVLLQQGGTLNAEAASQGCALVGWEKGAGGTSFSFEFSADDDLPPLVLAVPNVSSFTFYFDDQPLYRYDDREPSARLKLVDLPQASGESAMRFVFDGPQNSVRVQLGTAEQMDRLNVFGALLFMFCAGCQLLMLLYCLSLWAQKRDEVILGLMMALILLTVARDVTQPFALLPQYIPTALKSGLNLCIVSLMTLLGAWFAFPDFCERQKRMLPWAAVLVGVMIALCYATGGALFLPIYGACSLACAAVLVCGCARRTGWSRLMLYCFAFFVASFVFYTSVDMGLAPAGTLAVQGYIIQLNCLPFLFACMVAINGRFVGYYQELKRINVELDALVDERVRQLRVQEEQKHQLMTNVFHDLRSPLFIAKGCIESLEEHRDEAKAVALLRDRVGFMDQLTQDLFTIAKLEGEELLIVEDFVDLSELGEREVEAARMQAVGKGVDFEASIEPGCVVWGDQVRVEQAVQNLLSNAFAHTPSGGIVRLTVRTAADSVQVSVENTGQGIAPEDEPHIFERYYRVSSGGSNESSGLGLAIVSEIMKVHHGSVALENYPGEGSVFVLRFPKAPLPED